MNVIGNQCAAQTNFHKLHRRSEHYSPLSITQRKKKSEKLSDFFSLRQNQRTTAP